MGYTLQQFKAYQAGADKVERAKLASLLNVVVVGSRGDGKAVEKLFKALAG